MKTNINKYLKKFNSKRTPEKGGISLSYEDAIKYDMYSVYIKANDGKQYLFREFLEGKLKVLRWDDARKMFWIKDIVEIDSLSEDSFSGIYYYHGHELRFKSLRELSWFSELKFRYVADRSNKEFSRAKFVYRQQKQDITDALAVLSVLLRVYRSLDKEDYISEVTLMTEVAGALWIYHDDQEKMKKDLRLCLDYLVYNNDASKLGNSYKPTGKALDTLNTSNKENERYRETASIQKKMLFATFLSAFAAFMSAYATYKGIK